MTPAPIEVPREVRRQLATIQAAGTTGEVTIGGVKKHAFQGTLVTAECYAAMMEAADITAVVAPEDVAVPSAAEDAIDERNRQAALRREAAAHT